MRIAIASLPALVLLAPKVPSLKGVWDRGRYRHDGSLTTLEEMFDPLRLRDEFVRFAW